LTFTRKVVDEKGLRSTRSEAETEKKDHGCGHGQKGPDRQEPRNEKAEEGLILGQLRGLTSGH
jgi:hypothetical protein